MSDIIGALIDLGIQPRVGGSAQQKLKCPKCSDERRDKRDKSLSVNIEKGRYKCHYCSWGGSVENDLDDDKYERPDEVEVKETYNKRTVEFFKSRGIQQTTLVANKVTEETVWMPQDDAKVPTIIFNYYQHNRLINQKYRSFTKGFKMYKDAKLIFYNLDNTVGKSDIIITEGEIDALSFFEAGFNNAISVPNGANKGTQKLDYLDNCINYFDEAERIYLAVDNDDAGESLFHELSRRLGKERCFRISYPDECKDANDVLMKHGVDGVKELISGARPLPIEGVIDIEVERDAVKALYSSGIERGEELKEFGEHFDKICTFKTGKLYVISGIPGHGKSSMINDIEMVLAAKKGWKFGIFSPEHFPIQYMIYKYAELLVGKPFFEGESERMNIMELEKAMDFVRDHFYFIKPSGKMMTLNAILEVAGNLVSRYGIKGLTIDPWNTIEHDFEGKSETQYIEAALNRITLFKQERDVAVFVVAHPKKMQKAQSGERGGLYEVPNLYDISGSSNFFNKADMGICVYRDFSDGMTYFYLQKCKFRNLGEIGVCTFKYNSLNNRFEEAEKEEHNNNNINVLKIRRDNILQKDFEQSEISMVSPNANFEQEGDEEDDSLPF